MSKLNKLETIVKTILEKEEEARADDMYLYYLFCTKYGFLTDSAFARVFKDKEYRNNVGLSVFESVSRCRRKLQADNKNLRPSEKVQQARSEKESEYFNYAIGGYSSNFMDFVDNQE